METAAVQGHVEAPQNVPRSGTPQPEPSPVADRQGPQREAVRVDISSEARALREQTRSSETAPPSSFPSRVAGEASLPVIAVRLGLPPPPDLSDPEQLLREKLAEGARVQSVKLGGLLSTAQDREHAEASRNERPSDEPRVDRPEARERTEVPGGPEPVKLPAVEASRPELQTAPKPRPQPVEDSRAADEARETRQREILQRSDRRNDLETAVAAASQSGVARTEENAANRRADSTRDTDSADESARERRVKEALTQAGVVEAQTETELVTRFSERAFEQDLGRPERTREFLGQRSASPTELDD